MDKGTAKASFLFSDGEDLSGTKTCDKSKCTATAIAKPNNANIEVLTYSISGPAILIVFVGT